VSFLVSFKSTRSSSGATTTGERAHSIYSGLANNIYRIAVYIVKPAGQPINPGDEVTLTVYTPNANFAPSVLIATYHLMLQGVAVMYLANAGGGDWYYAQFVINQPLTPATAYCISLQPVGAGVSGVTNYRGLAANPPPYSTLGRVDTIMSWQFSGGVWSQLFDFSGAYNYHLEADETPLTQNTDLKAMAADTLSDAPLAAANGQSLCIDSAGNIYVAYTKFDLFGNYQVYLAKSPDGGATWTEEIVPGAVSVRLEAPSIAIDSLNNIHLVFAADLLLAGTNGIYYMLRDPVTGWGAVQTIYDAGVAGRFQESPDLAVDASDVVHIVWDGENHGVNTTKLEICYVPIVAGVPGALVQLTDVAYHQYQPKIAVDSVGNLHVAWPSSGGFGAHTAIANHIDYIKRTAGVWGSVIDFTDDWDYSTTRFNLAVIIVDDSDNPIVVYNNSSFYGRTLWYRKYTGTLSTPVNVPLPYRTLHEGFGVALDRSGNLHVFLTAWDSTDGGVIYRARLAGGSWDTFEYLTALGDAGISNDLGNALWANYPQIGGVKTNVAVAKPLIAWNKAGGATDQLWMWPASAPAGGSRGYIIA